MFLEKGDIKFLNNFVDSKIVKMPNTVSVYMLKKYQHHLVKMLKEFDEFCKKNELEFFLVGGSALGAYRHDGFIPWDDDVDIAMLRADFEKMERCMKQQNNTLEMLVYSPVENSIVPEAPIGHLYDLTVVNGKVEFAPKLDIHPLDGVPEKRGQQELQNIFSKVYYLGVYHLPAKNKGRFNRLVTKMLLLIIPDKIWSIILRRCKHYFVRWDAVQSRMLCSLFGVAGYKKEVMPRKWIYPLEEREFEGCKFKVPGDAEHYLKRLYGNWREVPPEEKRIPAHNGYLHYEEIL